MLAFLSLTGIFLSIILLVFNFRNNRSSVYLSLFFFSVSIYSLLIYVLLFSKSEVLVGIVFFNIGFLTYLTGPLLFLYTRSVLTDDSRLRRRDIWPIILRKSVSNHSTISGMNGGWSMQRNSSGREKRINIPLRPLECYRAFHRKTHSSLPLKKLRVSLPVLLRSIQTHVSYCQNESWFSKTRLICWSAEKLLTVNRILLSFCFF